MKSLLPPALGVLLVALSTGCYTTQIQPDYARQANAHLAAQEKPGASAADAEQKESLRRLWSDVPEYAAAVANERPLLKTPRLVSSTPPSYPLIPLLGGVKSRVVVSFVVSRTGTVAAARVLESFRASTRPPPKAC